MRLSCNEVRACAAVFDEDWKDAVHEGARRKASTTPSANWLKLKSPNLSGGCATSSPIPAAKVHEKMFSAIHLTHCKTTKRNSSGNCWFFHGRRDGLRRTGVSGNEWKMILLDIRGFRKAALGDLQARYPLFWEYWDRSNAFSN